jgi:hypothetical protein
MTRLYELLEAHARPIEADFLELYGVDLLDVWRGALTPRRALVLVEQLSNVPRSRYRAAVLDDSAWHNYGPLEGHLADLIDHVAALTFVTVKAAGGKPKKPTPYPRPPKPTDPAATVTVPDIDDFPIHAVQAMTSK